MARAKRQENKASSGREEMRVWCDRNGSQGPAKVNLLDRYSQETEPWKLLEEKLVLWYPQGQTCLLCSLCGVLKEGSSGAEITRERLQALW